jgi:membrane-bound ClpP family serine protease
LVRTILISMFGIAGLIGGLVMIIIGGIMAFFMPSAQTYQPSEMSTLMVLIGFVLIILGGVMIFV